MEESVVEIFGLPIGLGVPNRGEMLFDPKVLTPGFEGIISELPAVIRDDHPGQAETTNYALPEKFLNC